MAEALLRDRLSARGIEARVHSAGEMPGGVAASAGSVRAMAARGLDLGAHRSRQGTVEMLESADLVLAMARRHLRGAVAMAPSAFPRAFTIKELVRRAERHGPRRPGESLGEWLDALHRGRTTSQLLVEDRADDVADPIGQPDAAYEATARELEQLIERLIDLCVPANETRELA